MCSSTNRYISTMMPLVHTHYACVLTGNGSAHVLLTVRSSHLIVSLPTCLQAAHDLEATPAAPPKFSLSQIIEDPALANAALKELNSAGGGTDGRHPGEAAGGTATSHSLDLDRTSAFVQQLNQDVVEESLVNREISTLILQRLQASQQSLEGLEKLLRALSSAEAAYASAMHTAVQASQLRPGMRAKGGSQEGREAEPAIAALAQLPAVIASSHKQLSSSLSSLAGDLSNLVAQFRTAVREIGDGAGLAHRQVDEHRQALSAGLEQHVSACAALDTAMSERASGRLAKAPDKDPWQTEAQLVQVG
jgi:hypothetical protein